MALSETKFGKYTLLRRIASGGMAEIYLARQEGMAGFAREVVIKRIHEHLGKDQEFVSMFLDEARLVARLSHPNIVSVHEFGKEDESHYLVMEYVDGEALSTAIKRARGLDPQQGLRVVSEICAGLDYAHTLKDDTGQSLGIVHRDVSPQNVLLGYDGSVKLIDFGIAKASDQQHETRVGSFKGKYAYMAPEQARGKAADLRADVHAVGIVLWETLTGRSLFYRESVFHSMEAVLHLKPPSVLRKCPDLTGRIDEIIGKALAKDPDERYQSCHELQNDLDELAAELGLHSSSLALSRYIHTLFDRGSQPPPPDAAEALGPDPATRPQNMVLLDRVATEPERPSALEIVATAPDHRPALDRAPTHSEEEVVDIDLVEDLLEQELFEPTFEPELPRPPPPRPSVPAPRPSAPVPTLADEWDDLPETTRRGLEEGLPPPRARPHDRKPQPTPTPTPTPVEPLLEAELEVEPPRRTSEITWVVIALMGFTVIVVGLYLWLTSQDGGSSAEREAGAAQAALGVRPTQDEPDAPAPDQVPPAREAGPDAPEASPGSGDAEPLEEAGPELVEGLPTAFLTIHSSPAGAKVWIDGRQTGERTSVRDLPLDPGEHTVDLTLDDYHRFRTTVTVEPEQTMTVRATLTAAATVDAGASEHSDGGSVDYGLLTVDTVPPSRVLKQGRELGQTPLRDLELPAGSYTLTFVTESGLRFDRTVSVRAGRTTRRRFELLPQANESAPQGSQDAPEPPPTPPRTPAVEGASESD